MAPDEPDRIKALMSEILNVQKLLLSGLGREFMELFFSLLNVCFENADVHQTRNHQIQSFPTKSASQTNSGNSKCLMCYSEITYFIDLIAKLKSKHVGSTTTKP